MKKASINIENPDDICFKCAIQCGFQKIYEKSHSEKFYHYKKIEDGLDFDEKKFQLIMMTLINLNSVRMFQLICLKLMRNKNKE